MSELRELLEEIEFDLVTRAEKFHMLGDSLVPPVIEGGDGQPDQGAGDLEALVQTLKNMMNTLQFMRESFQGTLDLLGEASGRDLRYIEAITRHLVDRDV